jgi:4-amino-4-deoxy-L-arabinose transferase-like glycosyltransferase
LPVIAVAHSQMVRTDSAATFFGLLSLWFCLKVYDRPTLSRFTLAGLSIGLAIASRYFMVALFPLLLVAAGLTWRRKRTEADRRRVWPGLGLAGLSVALTFALSTPYFFLDFQAALYWIVAEANDVHIDADGLSPLGNLVWYLSQAIPASLTWPGSIELCVPSWKRPLIGCWRAVGIFWERKSGPLKPSLPPTWAWRTGSAWLPAPTPWPWRCKPLALRQTMR